VGHASFKASAPGKLFLFGEHAVLHNHSAIVCAGNQRITVTLTTRSDQRINIDSDIGRYSADLHNIQYHPEFRFLLKAIESQNAHLNKGFDLVIESDFSSHVGLGSSSAITAATITVLYSLRGTTIDLLSIFKQSFQVIRDIQGMASGADLAACVFGGIIAYRKEPLEIVPLEHLFPLSVVYSGSKMSTTKVIALVEKRRESNPVIFDQSYALINQISLQAAEAVKNKDWLLVGELLNMNQGLMDAIGVCNEALSTIVYTLRGDSGIIGSKISGSGLGDCVVGLGTVKDKHFSYPLMPIQMSSVGLQIE